MIIHKIKKHLQDLYHSFNKTVKSKKKLKIILTKLLYKKYWIIPLPLLLCVFSALIVLRGGFFHPEADYFLQNALSNKPFIAKIFSAENHRDGAYQAREFSYVIDFIDANILLVSARIGLIHFYGLLHYLSLLLVAALSILLSTRYFGQKNYVIA